MAKHQWIPRNVDTSSSYQTAYYWIGRERGNRQINSNHREQEVLNIMALGYVDKTLGLRKITFSFGQENIVAVVNFVEFGSFH